MTYEDVARIVKVVDPAPGDLRYVLETMNRASTDLVRVLAFAAAPGVNLDMWFDFVDSTVSMIVDLIFGGRAPRDVTRKLIVDLIRGIIGQGSQEANGDKKIQVDEVLNTP